MTSISVSVLEVGQGIRDVSVRFSGTSNLDDSVTISFRDMNYEAISREVDQDLLIAKAKDIVRTIANSEG